MRKLAFLLGAWNLRTYPPDQPPADTWYVSPHTAGYLRSSPGTLTGLPQDPAPQPFHPADLASYALSVSPWRRGQHTRLDAPGTSPTPGVGSGIPERARPPQCLPASPMRILRIRGYALEASRTRSSGKTRGRRLKGRKRRSTTPLPGRTSKQREANALPGPGSKRDRTERLLHCERPAWTAAGSSR